MQRLEGRVAVVTGAASGIGLALAERFARAGMKLVLADIEAAALQRALVQLQAQGAHALAVPVDVADAASVEALADAAYRAHGAVHVLCNNAGVAAPALLQPTWENSLADWQWILGVNLMGVVHGVRAFVPRMLAELSASVLCPGIIRTAILDAERNRPAAYGRPTDLAALSEKSQRWASGFRAALEAGIDPSVVADAVADAIVTDRFYIVPAQPEHIQRIAARMADIVALRNPTLPEPRA